MQRPTCLSSSIQVQMSRSCTVIPNWKNWSQWCCSISTDGLGVPQTTTVIRRSQQSQALVSMWLIYIKARCMFTTLRMLFRVVLYNFIKFNIYILKTYYILCPGQKTHVWWFSHRSGKVYRRSLTCWTAMPRRSRSWPLWVRLQQGRGSKGSRKRNSWR